jgi:TRAP-type C4-dicarboxylate transport system permease small subunit
MMQHLIKRSADLLTLLAALCLLLMMGQIVLDVLLKYLLNTPIEGNLEIVSYYYMVGVVFLPLAMVELRHEHINVDLFVRLLPMAGQCFVYVFGSLVSAVFFAVLAYQTFLDALEATRVGEIMMGSIYVTIWPSRWALPVGFTLVCLAVLLHTWRAVWQPDGFDPTPAEPDVYRSNPRWD